jgi:hypothetical protein
VFRRLRRSLAAVAGTLLLTLGAASPVAAAGTETLVGSPYAAGYANGWYQSVYADQLAFDLLVKHHRTVLRCAPSAFSLLLPGVGPLRTLSAARAARVQGYTRTSRTTQVQKLGSVVNALQGVTGKGCTAAYRVARAAYIVHKVGQQASHVYFADRSTFQQRAGFNSCVIDIVVSGQGMTTARYSADYRFCGPTW